MISPIAQRLSGFSVSPDTRSKPLRQPRGPSSTARTHERPSATFSKTADDIADLKIQIGDLRQRVKGSLIRQAVGKEERDHWRERHQASKNANWKAKANLWKRKEKVKGDTEIHLEAREEKEVVRVKEVIAGQNTMEREECVDINKNRHPKWKEVRDKQRKASLNVWENARPKGL